MDDQAKLLSILSNCEKDQLNIYLNEEDSIEALIKSLESYQELVSAKENLHQLNKQIAEANLAKEPLLDQLKQKLTEAITQFEDAKAAYRAVKEAFDAQQSVNGDMSLQGVLSQLQASAEKAEDESDMEAAEFFSNFSSSHSEEELNNFQRQFLEKRTQAHLKKIKAEKMKELLPSYFM
jgi:ESCRT-I complex subunit VPS37